MEELKRAELTLIKPGEIQPQTRTITCYREWFSRSRVEVLIEALPKRNGSWELKIFCPEKNRCILGLLGLCPHETTSSAAQEERMQVLAIVNLVRAGIKFVKYLGIGILIIVFLLILMKLVSS